MATAMDKLKDAVRHRGCILVKQEERTQTGFEIIAPPNHAFGGGTHMIVELKEDRTPYTAAELDRLREYFESCGVYDCGCGECDPEDFWAGMTGETYRAAVAAGLTPPADLPGPCRI